MEQLDRFLTEIEIALSGGAPLPALAMAVALPDICTTLEFPGNEETSRTTYETWCSDYVEDRSVSKANHLYPLRCAFLHNGTTNVTHQRSRGTLEGYRLSMDRGGIVLGLTKTDVATGATVNAVTMSLPEVCGWLIAAVREW